MRKALMSVILAATVLSPVAADAQRWRGGDQGGDRVREQNESSDSQRQPRSEQRIEQRQERQQQREARQVQQQPQVQVQQAPVVQQRERGDRNRGGDGNRNWRGNNDGNANTGGTRDRNGDGNRRNWRGGGNQESIYPQAWQGDPNDPRLRRYQETERRNQNRYDNNRRGDWRGDRNGGRNWRNDWNRNWRNDNRYDWQRYRYSNRNLFRAGRYYSPYRNYNYTRFNIGFFLEPLFYGRNYWIGDPWQYRLPPAYPGTQWVRYYNDVLLVDIYTGEVIDVIYGFFW